jgi:hypothetical protein
MAHAVTNYTIGKGVPYVSLDSGSTWIDMGNPVKFTLTPKVEKKAHFSNRAGIKTKDQEFVISAEAELKFTLDEPEVGNLARFLGDDTYSGSGAIDIKFNDIACQIKFVMANTKGLKYEWLFESVNISASEGIDLVGDDYQQLPFTASVLADDTGSFGTATPIV